MKIYVAVASGLTHLVIAKNASEALEMMTNYLNQSKSHGLYETSDFSVSTINVDKFSDPTIIF